MNGAPASTSAPRHRVTESYGNELVSEAHGKGGEKVDP